MNNWAIPGVSLHAAGLVALSDLTSTAQRTALTGTASYLDILFIAPGIHRQQAASALNGGELPATGALTTGYVFRIENQATVSFMQRVGRAGHLVILEVIPPDQRSGSIIQFFTTGGITSYLYLLGPALTLLIIVFLSLIGDWWGVGAIGMLILARLLNVIVIKRRSVLGWKGAPEPGVRGDLLVLLNQDRWIRMRGLVDDLKTVTSGQWLRDETMVEGFMSSTATLLVFMTAGLAGNASPIGCLLLACLLLTSAALLGFCNSLTKNLQMFGCVVQTSGEPVAYRRRLDLAEELIKESGRDDWAIGLGMITVKGMKPATM